jgi:putative restriction endonuclease
MARLSKSAMLEIIRAALKQSGYETDVVSKTHPFQIVARNNSSEEDLSIYVWNVTHGGKSRAASEYRIQITGVSGLKFASGQKTLLLGIAQQPVSGTVIVGFDATKHREFGSSPSIQVHAPTLLKAEHDGLASETKELDHGKSEIVFAFRPENFGQFIGTICPAYHVAGKTIPTDESSKVSSLDFSKPDLSDADLSGVAAGRKKALIAAAMWVRDQNFRRNVLHVYDYCCAICGLQANLVQGGHIVGVGKKGTDEVINGMCLCSIHHDAYDRGLLAVDENYTIRKNLRMAKALKSAGLAGGLTEFFANSRVGQKIRLPKDLKFAPKPEYLKANLSAKGPQNFE